MTLPPLPASHRPSNPPGTKPGWSGAHPPLRVLFLPLRFFPLSHFSAFASLQRGSAEPARTPLLYTTTAAAKNQRPEPPRSRLPGKAVRRASFSRAEPASELKAKSCVGCSFLSLLCASVSS